MATSLNSTIHYGISENDEHICLVEYDQETYQTYRRKKPAELLSLPNENSRIIRAVPHYLIWRTVFFLPKSYTDEQIYPQVIRTLRQSLPLELNELQFDYQIQPLDNRLRIALFVIRKSALAAFNLMPHMIVDCELHCIARAIHHLNQVPMENISQYSYPFGKLYFQFSEEGLVISDIQPEDTHLISIPPPRFDDEIEDQLLYLKALGAALWNGTGLI